MALVESPENIPLEEAVARGLIPCSICGAPGATLRKAGQASHFLCPRCFGKGRIWGWGLAALLIAIVGLGGFLLYRRRPAPLELPPPMVRDRDPEEWTKETLRLMDQKRYREARARIEDLLGAMPGRPDLNLLMGQCLMATRAYDDAVPHLTVAYEAGPPYRDEAALWLGLSLKTMGRSSQALKYLEESTLARKRMRTDLAEVYLDLERYEDALKNLPEPSDSGALWARHRALVYQGKAAEGKKLLEGCDPMEVATLLAGQLREEGDFVGAARALAVLEGKVRPGSPAWHRAKRAEISLAIESGDLEKLEAVASELSADPDVEIQGEAVFARAIGALLAGRRDAAKTRAWEFLAKTNKEFSPLRLERMMMRHLAGELKDSDLEAEIKQLSRFHANDLLWYLALATGERSWAERALASTPGHNFPYHAIRRLLDKK